MVNSNSWAWSMAAIAASASCTLLFNAAGCAQGGQLLLRAGFSSSESTTGGAFNCPIRGPVSFAGFFAQRAFRFHLRQQRSFWASSSSSSSI